jgi:pyridoxal phosphate enzyme (YggS family)
VVSLWGLGVTDVGENRDQEASAKVAALPPQARAGLRVHFIGQLQTNKAASAAAYADVVHSVDRARLATALDHGAERVGRRLGALVQVSLDRPDGRGGRAGVAPADVPALADLVAAQPSLDLLGVMAVAPLGADPAAAFAQLASVADRLRSDHPGAGWISAGMSADLEAALAHGATHLRVGSAILGSRPPFG